MLASRDTASNTSSTTTRPHNATMWKLTAFDATGVIHSEPTNLRKDDTAHIVVLASVLGVTHTLPSSPPSLLQHHGHITVGPWGMRLEAIQPLIIIPGHVCSEANKCSAISPDIEKYQLNARSDERSEILILRHGDTVQPSGSASRVVCKWVAPEVQVNSSALETQANKPLISPDIAASPEEDTEDEGLDHETEVATTTQQPKATPVPRLSNQTSIVVQETPTADRVVGATKFSRAMASSQDDTPLAGHVDSLGLADSAGEEEDAKSNSAEPTKSLQHGDSIFGTGVGQLAKNNLSAVASEAAVDAITPPSRTYPQVQIPQRLSRKRGSPTTTDKDPARGQADEVRSTKRTKRDAEYQDDTQDSRMSAIEVDVREKSEPVIVAKGRKRKSEISEAPTEAPPRSQRNSQRSNTAVADSTPYTGPTPRVAVSNSSLVKSGQAIKFLKRQGGSFIESAEESFNVLCVRDGELLKTPKLLLSIARGTSIVTEKWLTDSAKAGHLLDIAAYVPSAPKQEKEWNIRISEVVGHPQTPFTGYTVHFTKAVKATYGTFSEIEILCKAAGAKKAVASITRLDKDGQSIVLAKDDGDAELAKLLQDGITCYHKDLITQSIFRGTLDLDSAEFKIEADATPRERTKKKRQKSK